MIRDTPPELAGFLGSLVAYDPATHRAPDPMFSPSPLRRTSTSRSAPAVPLLSGRTQQDGRSTHCPRGQLIS